MYENRRQEFFILTNRKNASKIKASQMPFADLKNCLLLFFCLVKRMHLSRYSDTLTCLNGAFAEAYYGLPEQIWDQAKEFIPGEMITIIDKFYGRLQNI